MDENNPDKENSLRQLREAMRENDVETFRRLAPHHPEEFAARRNLIRDVARHGHLEMVKELIAHGYDVNEQDFSPFEPRENTPAPIDDAAGGGHLELVRWFADNGGMINNEKGFSRPLNDAATSGHLEVCKFLVERGANPHSARHGGNVLMQAAAYGHFDVVEYLRSLGAKDLRETTPPDYPTAHKVFLEEMTKKFGVPLANTFEVSGDPAINIYLCPANAPKPKANPDDEDSCCDDDECEAELESRHTLFTIGLSDRRLGRKGDPFAATELRMYLHKDWPIDEKSLQDPRYRWPIDWLIWIASQLRDAEKMPETPSFFADNPPTAFHESTSFHWWACSRYLGDYCQVPGCRWIDTHELVPVYDEEKEILEQEDGVNEIAQRMDRYGITNEVVQKRPNVVTDRDALEAALPKEDEED